MLSAISLTYNRKSRGASTEKCGTPAFVFTRVYLELFTNTH
jgi:hypothetical protein